MAARETIGVVYLCRDLQEIGHFSGFLKSYKKHRAGLPHQLLIVFKGRPPSLNEQEILQKYRVNSDLVFEAPERGYDLGTYDYMSQRLDTDILCFMNTGSRILAKDWLKFLATPILQNNAGLTSATASWESFSTELLGKTPPSVIDGWPNFPKYFLDFPPFPNPHLRTNAFCIRRSDWRKLTIGELSHKVNCWLAESGKNSITRQILQMGKNVLLVDRKGRCYEPARWNVPEVFRSGCQAQLLVSDNQTEQYAASGSAERLKMWHSTWFALSLSNPISSGTRILDSRVCIFYLTFSLKRTLKALLPWVYGFLQRRYGKTQPQQDATANPKTAASLLSEGSKSVR